MSKARRTPRELFNLGDIVATPGALQALTETGRTAYSILSRHAQGDWGDVCQSDKRSNDAAVKDGSRILSAYEIGEGAKIWIITDAADEEGVRHVTTLLLPEEY